MTCLHCGRPTKNPKYCSNACALDARGVRTHGMSKHPLFALWCGIRARCANDPYYSGRGIAVYPPWQNDPKAFIDWIEANLGPRPDGLSLDRIDNDGDYEPGNLRWATRSVQSLNRRTQANGGAYRGADGELHLRPRSTR